MHVFHLSVTGLHNELKNNCVYIYDCSDELFMKSVDSNYNIKADFDFVKMFVIRKYIWANLGLLR